MYPGAQGIFFDEMLYEDTDAGAEHQAALNRYAHGLGYWPTVANPEADTPERYFAADAADGIPVHEGDLWPAEERLKGDTAGGYADYPPFSRGILLHSQPKLDKDQLQMARKYVRWIYVAEGLFRPGDPKTVNPWNRVSTHLREICEQFSQN